MAEEHAKQGVYTKTNIADGTNKESLADQA
jgi:hypothetical protein